MSTVEMDPSRVEESAGSFVSAAEVLDEDAGVASLPAAVTSALAERLVACDELETQQRARSAVRCADVASQLRTAARQAVRVDAAVR